MSQQGKDRRASAWLKWEWRAALITVVGGIVIAIAIAAYFTFRKPPPAPLSPDAARQAAFVKAAQLVCLEALQTSKNFGIVPQYAGLARPLPLATKKTGRYVCVGGTKVSHYNLVVDLVCRQINQAKCVNLVGVVQDDGTVLYQRMKR